MNIALILAGGTGTRLGNDIPKQYIKVNNKMIISYCYETFFDSEEIDAIWIVANSNWHDVICRDIQAIDNNKVKFKGFCEPGANRQLSILNGLEAVKAYYVGRTDEIKVMIHDAARPLLTETLIKKCFDASKGHDGVMPVIPVKDTIYVSDNGETISGLLDRNKLFAGQAPEVFDFNKYYNACIKLLPDDILKINGSTEPAIKAGMDIAICEGDENNYKITTKADLERFETYLNSR